MTIDKTFDPAAIEAKWYAHWESTGAFRPERPDAEPYTIVNPPPNVTGSLHIGHALDNTLQDILIRHARLQGKDALWVVGTDHAGIATQMVVERQMAQKQQKRTDFTRDEFVAKVWEWKEESGGEITRQLRRLGCSMDWENERFTMDEGFSKAVIKVFVDLYNQGLLYRDKRLVNWDPHFKTAISDLEVETREVSGHMWHFKYPLAGGETYTYVERDADGNITVQEERDYIAIATTRPETMLGDGAVAVHPDDERYKPIIGKLCEIPVGPKEHRRLIPIITDEYPDPDFGSGAVKITGAHDQNDYGVAQRNGIPMYRLMDEVAAMRSDGAPYAEAAAQAKSIAARKQWTAAEIDALNLVPDAYRGLDRYEARKRVVADIDADGLMIAVESKVIQQPFGDRSAVVIEPMLTDQWYVDAKTLAAPAIEAVRSGAIDIVPKSWEKTYFNWMENIQPWCVSRQLWWGHQIPAWFDSDGKCYVAETEAEAQGLAGEGVALTRDPDVLDTWFSSALWPFGTLGWPDQTRELDRHYPNDVLVSGFDILFFWDARMAMQGIHFMKEVPWKTLYLHGLVRAADGSKMSKSKGNTVDPLGLIDQYGADALRFFMAAMESQGRDIKMDESRVAGYRNFATKLWNAARFAQSNGIGGSHSISAPKAELAVNRWIIGEVVETVEKLNKAFAEFRFDGMADAIYHFVWDQFCDWYLELIKPAFVDGEKQDMDPESQMVAGWVLDQILVMLHPFMPFVTEELWHALADPAAPRAYDLIHARWPEPKAEVDADAKAEVEWLIRLVGEVRTAKNELGIAPGAKMDAFVRDASPATEQRIARQQSALARLARLDSVTPGDAPEGGSVQLVVDEATFVLPLAGVIDLDAERARISKAIEAATKEAASLSARLSNAAFVEKAKPEAVEKARADHAEKTAEAERLTAALARLG
ncbi:valine--tRNA ligase [Sphingorhabdus contaminans]|uniref:Valine--tRNA ligase n=1 Tax=Sphingorhabdus contaminans TaxID=1343899 RepID=A0A553WAZ8_9SPHN|nr:valine--tRNA ligase [Sphingorhabdus contaminans]TSB01865.1 valine--tRNA ligase [Sphingorhabdus contaminans]